MSRLPLLQILDDRPEVRFRLRLRDARLEPSKQVNEADALGHPPPLEHDRQVNIRAAPHESLRHDSNNGADLVIQAELPPHHARVAAKLALPKTVTENTDWLRLGLTVARQDRPPQPWGHAHHPKCVRRAVVSAQPLRIAFTCPHDVADRRGDHPLKDRTPPGDLEELIGRVVCPVSLLAGIPDLDTHQVVHILVRERVQHDCVNHTVHRRGRHDPKRERKHGHGGEAGVFQQLAEGEFEVVHGSLKALKGLKR